MKGKVYFIDSVHPFLSEELREQGWQCVDASRVPAADLPMLLADAMGIVIRSRVTLDRRMIDAAPILRFIARSGSGMENLDYAYARQRGIHCLNAPEGNRDSVGEHALGMLLAMLNHLVRGDREVRSALWRREANRGRELMGKTVAIIGYGNTGSAFAQRLQGFGVRTIAYDKYKQGFSDAFVEECSMEEVFAEADVLSLHVPLTEETRYLVNEAYIGRFARPFWLVNTSRGPVVNTDDLVAALKQGAIRGAALDVLEYEKRSFEALEEEDFPAAFQELRAMDQVVLSPHVAGWTDESLLKLAQVLSAKVRELDFE